MPRILPAGAAKLQLDLVSLNPTPRTLSVAKRDGTRTKQAKRPAPSCPCWSGSSWDPSPRPPGGDQRAGRRDRAADPICHRSFLEVVNGGALARSTASAVPPWVAAAQLAGLTSARSDAAADRVHRWWRRGLYSIWPRGPPSPSVGSPGAQVRPGGP